jgi:SAM-dependent methyltransferase
MDKKVEQRAETGAADSGDDEEALIFFRRVLFVAVLSLAAVFVKPAWNRPAQPGTEIAQALYSVEGDQLQAIGRGPAAPQLHTTFVASSLDQGTEAFLSECRAASATRSGRVALHGRHQLSLFVQRMLGWSHTDAIGLSGHVPLFPASEEQLRRLVGSSAARRRPDLLLPSGAGSVRTMLDIGAGEGAVTERLASALGIDDASGVSTLETSAPHRRSLAQRGFHSVSSFDELQRSEFDVVALLHVLDRCDEPRALLELAAQRVAPGGLLIIATPLPFCPKVWSGRFGRVLAARPPTGTPLELTQPPAACPSNARQKQEPPSFEVSVSAFAAGVLEPLREVRKRLFCAILY